MARARAITFLWAAALVLLVGVLTGCTNDRTDWAGISRAMKERRP